MSANHPATRVLAALELLQAHGRLTGQELAERLDVDRRTVRRYIQALEEMGIPITTERGPHGGYELVAGFKLPPMMFTYDEVLALSLGLAAVRGFEFAETAPAVAGAQSKLERVMPANLKGRMRSVGEAVSIAARPSTLADSSAIPVLSSAAHGRTGVQMRYRSMAGAESERDFDPYGLALNSGHWYVVGYCHLREGVRTFRLDRVIRVTSQARAFVRPSEFDVAEHVAVTLATFPRKYSIEVWLETDLASARRELFQAIGVLEAHAGRVLLRSQADDLDWFARELARLPWGFEVAKPAELRYALKRHARALIERHAG